MIHIPQIILLTDIPVWVRPLAALLEKRGARVTVVEDPEMDLPEGLNVNRLSTRLAGKDPQRTAHFEVFLKQLEANKLPIVNGSRCFRLGYSKEEQAKLFTRCGALTPPTAPAIAGGRAFPGRAVLLKPAAGGFGKGIRALAPEEPAPAVLPPPKLGWIEQEQIIPADHSVHRLEILGDRILYDAQSPLIETDYNYCLAHAGEETILRGEDEIQKHIAHPALRIARAAGMELGALEYLLQKDGSPVFIDLNPVSSLHPDVSKMMGFDPLERTAAFLVERALRQSSHSNHKPVALPQVEA